MIRITDLIEFKDYKGNIKTKRVLFTIEFTNGSSINAFSDIKNTDLVLTDNEQKVLVRDKARKIRNEIADILDVNKSEISEQSSDWNEEFE